MFRHKISPRFDVAQHTTEDHSAPATQNLLAFTPYLNKWEVSLFPARFVLSRWLPYVCHPEFIEKRLSLLEKTGNKRWNPQVQLIAAHCSSCCWPCGSRGQSKPQGFVRCGIGFQPKLPQVSSHILWEMQVELPRQLAGLNLHLLQHDTDFVFYA